MLDLQAHLGEWDRRESDQRAALREERELMAENERLRDDVERTRAAYNRMD